MNLHDCIFEQGRYYETSCFDCKKNRSRLECDEQCCIKCDNCEMYLYVKTTTFGNPTYDIRMHCVFRGSCFPGNSCEHYIRCD